MVNITEKAISRIQQIKESEADKEKQKDTFVRVSVSSGGCSGLTYQLDFDDEMRPDDQVFEDKGEKVVTDPRSLMYLFGTTLDFSDGLNGKGFFFDNPNASRTCSCGESFSV